MQIRFLVLASLAGVLAPASLLASDLPPQIISLTSSNAQKKVTWVPYPAAQGYGILSASNMGDTFASDLSGRIAGTTWTGSSSNDHRFYRLAVTPLSSNALLTANVLNRLAYGPTPDDLERLATNGPQAYIDDQLNIQGVPETLDAYTVVQTNGVNGGQGFPNTNWVSITVTGRYTSPVLYIYMTTPGQAFIDDLQIRPMYFSNVVSMVGTNMVTNSVPFYGTNLVVDGDFETPLAGTWFISTNMVGSGISFSNVCGGTGSLHVVSLSPGSTQGTSIYQTNLTNVASTIISNNQPVQLSYKYLPGPGTDRLKIRLSGSGLVSSADDAPPAPSWIYATATGTANATPNIYIYLSGASTANIDDLKLVAGSVPESGVNLVQNGDFESALSGPWQLSANFTNSYIDSTLSHAGNGSLKVVATDAGSGNGNAVFQVVPGLANGATYTVSFWYQPATRGQTMTVRLSGSLLVASPDRTLGGLNRRLNTIAGASLDDLRAWFCRHSVEANRQLLEVLCQFWENHFVTQYSKSVEYLNVFTQDFDLQGRYAADWEYREQTKWRNAMLNPQCTFYDLLKVSAESPAMIVYLDTVNSKGNGNNIANENYARELLELFTFGVDNGYDQTDIVSSSRAWTGWSVELVDPENLNNPFAPQSQTYNPNVSSTGLSNTVGVLAFNYKAGNHGTNRAPVFLGKTVPARFGSPWVGRNYQLSFPGTGRTTGATNGIQDGYDVIRHYANQPFTEEYISVKLCRLFVHDDFPNPTTRTDLTNDYAFYDYTNPNRSAEAELVHQCMLAWENGNPKGEIRDVLRVIFNSDLFRASAASMQKIKTPMEYVASSVRALRSTNVDGTATAGTDGYSFSTPISRMGAMQLFNRAEPNGYPEAGPPWISAGTLAERIRYIQALLGSGVNDDAGNNVCNPVALLQKKIAVGNLKNAGVVVDYILSLLYPGEGKANLDLYRTAAIHYLDDGSVDPVSNNTSTLFFSQLTVSNSATSSYDIRVRGMVSMLLTFQRFHEQ